MSIPKEILTEIRKRMRNVLQEIIEEEAYSYVEKHPDTLWTALELADALKDFERNGGNL